MTNFKFTNAALSIAQVLIGSILFAVTVKLFLIPADLVTAGATGLAMAAHHVWGFSISKGILVFNILAIIAGLFVMGKQFVATTLLCSFVYPISLDVLDYFLGQNYILTDDLILNTLFAGIGMGFSLGIVLKAGSSTGGADIIPLAMNKYFHIPVSVAMWIVDFAILLAQIPLHPVDKILYGIILIVIYTVILDKVMILGTTRTELKIVSKKYKEITEAIIKHGDRGVTLMDCEGGYLHEQTQLVYSVISNRQLPKIEKLIHSIDPECFMVVTRVNEVKGYGFTLPKADAEIPKSAN